MSSLVQTRSQRLAEKKFPEARTVAVAQDRMIDLGCSRDATMAAAANLLKALRTNTNLVAAVHQVIAASVNLDKTYKATVDDANVRLGRRVA